MSHLRPFYFGLDRSRTGRRNSDRRRFDRTTVGCIDQKHFMVFKKNLFRSKNVLNEMEMLQRISTLESGPIHAFNPQLYQQQIFQSQCLPPSALNPSVLNPSVQTSSRVMQPGPSSFMVQAAPPPPQQQQPRAPEPSYKGMSCENFHALVRRKLEDVAQAALNRTDGEREYQQKELILKNRLR